MTVMCELISKLLMTAGKWNWSEILKVAAACWTAIIATLALDNWKRQTKAQKQTEFLDELTDAVHEFINLIAAPTEMVRYIMFGVESYSGMPQLDKSLKNPEAVAYIQKQGVEDAKKLYEYLKPCTSVLAKIQSLVAKGQVFGFSKYSECQNSCSVMARQQERIQALCYMIGNPSHNWQNSKVQDTLASVLTISADNLKQQLQEQNVKFIVFVKDSYAAAYK